MSEHDGPQDEAAPDAPEAAADDVIEGGDEDVASTVDNLAVGSITSSTPSPQPEGVEGDPIGDAEEHIASLDMDEERRKVAQLQQRL